ncbi:MAG: phosphoenolpyruvate-utilizing N-terminal domain-containing protein [Victivallales bacterium]
MKSSDGRAGLPDKKIKREVLYHGIPASPGIAIGTVMLIAELDRTLFKDIKITGIAPEQVDTEFALFRQAIDKTRDEIKELRTRVQTSLESHEANIFDAHFLIVDDKMLITRSAPRFPKN